VEHEQQRDQGPERLRAERQRPVDDVESQQRLGQPPREACRPLQQAAR
jgi:hypothetical protein